MAGESIESSELENLNRLRAVECESCGTIFAVPAAVFTDRLHECGFLHCPSGHAVHLENGSENTGDLVPIDVQILTEAQ
jgi:urease beta subunit